MATNFPEGKERKGERNEKVNKNKTVVLGKDFACVFLSKTNHTEDANKYFFIGTVQEHILFNPLPDDMR